MYGCSVNDVGHYGLQFLKVYDLLPMYGGSVNDVGHYGLQF